MSRADQDLRLGSMAIERGWVSPVQLDQALREQEAVRVRPIGLLLVSRGILTEAQLLELLREQSRILIEQENLLRTDLLFGQLLVKLNRATQNQINKCLEIQLQRVHEPEQRIPRLGELLVEHGFVTAETVQQVLRIQNKEILVCRKCGRQINAVDVRAEETYRCRSCGGTLETHLQPATLRVDETNQGDDLRE